MRIWARHYLRKANLGGMATHTHTGRLRLPHVDHAEGQWGIPLLIWSTPDPALLPALSRPF